MDNDKSETPIEKQEQETPVKSTVNVSEALGFSAPKQPLDVAPIKSDTENVVPVEKKEVEQQEPTLEEIKAERDRIKRELAEEKESNRIYQDHFQKIGQIQQPTEPPVQQSAKPVNPPVSSVPVLDENAFAFNPQEYEIAQTDFLKAQAMRDARIESLRNQGVSNTVENILTEKLSKIREEAQKSQRLATLENTFYGDEEGRKFNTPIGRGLVDIATREIVSALKPHEKQYYAGKETELFPKIKARAKELAQLVASQYAGQTPSPAIPPKAPAMETGGARKSAPKSQITPLQKKIMDTINAQGG